jgi:hypothetical protein
MGASPVKWVQGLHNYVHTQHTYAWAVYAKKIAEGVPHGKSRRLLSQPARRFARRVALFRRVSVFSRQAILFVAHTRGQYFGKKKI